MAYVPNVADVDKWKNHYVHMAEHSTKQKDFYAVRPKLKGNGSESLVIVSPTEQSVERAKSEIKYKRKLDDKTSHSPTRNRIGNIKNRK